MKISTFKKLSRSFTFLLFPVIGIFFLYHQTQRPKVKSENDLIYIDGKIKDYSFAYQSGRSTSKIFYIWIEGYKCKFQIIADYISYFEKSKFEENKKLGDSLSISIPKENETELYKNEKIIAMSINDNKNIYLSEKDTIAEENKHFDIYAGIGFLILGGIVYILSKKGTLKIK